MVQLQKRTSVNMLHLIVVCESKGDLEYLKGEESAFYSIYDGFVYYDIEGNLIPYEFMQMTEDDWSGLELEKSYDGHLENASGDGLIEDASKYVDDKYGKKYCLYAVKHLYRFEYVEQCALSIYKKKVGDAHQSEGNCTLSSIYALLNYLQIVGKIF